MACPPTINPWLCEKLKQMGVIKDPPSSPSGPTLSLLIQIEPKAANDVIATLRKMGLSPSQPFFFNQFIEVSAPAALVPAIAQIPGVVKVNYNMPVSIPSVSASYVIPPFPVLPQAPINPPPSISPLAANDKFIPTSLARQVMGLPEDNVLRNTLVAVLDTGGPWPWHPQVQGLTEVAMSFVPFEPSPLDGHGHGSWCTTAAIGKEANTTYGPVKGAATAGSKVIFAKVLSNLGMGKTSWIIKGMEWAYLQGAKVISMSLGGEPQGGVDDDPFCQVINTLYKVGVYTVVASGDSGPDLWTTASPGFCPNALTVGAYVITDNDISWFSSNGPSARWYKEHPQQWREDYAKYGDLIVKPDVVAPGGGRKDEKLRPWEYIYSGCTGYFCGTYSGSLMLGYPYEGLMGTSQSTPLVAGAVALAFDRGLISSIDDVKNRMKAAWGKEKDPRWGWGLLKWSIIAG
jgi:subtilisin family serine protease